jgi:flagellar biosynthesis regulator FlaF
LEVQGSGFSGRTTVRRGGDWELVVLLEAGRKLESANPVLHVVAVPDSAPQITVPVPGVDTTVAPSLRQLLVIDARDDHLLTRIELTTRRASRTGNGGHTETDTIPLPVGGTDRAVLQWVIDLNDRGFLPGDTAYYRVRAVDNAPNPQVSETREFALYLPSLSDIREAVRDAADDLVSDTDSLLRAQRDLAEATRNLAAEGDRRDDATRGDRNDRMDFRSVEEAAEIAEEQEQLVDRARELADQLQELAESGWDAGITDPEWHKLLAELQQMLEQAITPEMQETLEQLRQSLEQLDAEGVQELLEQLADAQEKLREQLERSRELFERAALEGQMSTLADDAVELADRQNQWNESVEDAAQSDSTLAANEAALAAEAERLRDRLEQLQEALDRVQEGGEQVQQSQQSTEQAGRQMRQAARQASQGQQQQARQSGESASQNLEAAGDGLREQLEQMRRDWREEVMKMMDDALIETADLAERQQSVEQRLRRGESGGEVRGDQAAIREGVDRVIDRLQNAAGKNALVSPNLSAGLGLARLKMTEALQELQEATPNTRQAGERAGRALDGLNEVAYALLRNRGDVEGSESGSGMAEAMEQMAQLAQEQQAMASESGQMLPMMVQGRQALLQQLRELAERQRELGEELERMDAEGAPNAAEQLAEEALQIARELEAGRLDRETVERQQRLFRRLLDAGRTLRSDEEDEREERRSETGDQANVRVPPELSGPRGPEARYPYPRWDQLRRFTPEERRLILDYFRRLNAERRQ